MTRTTLLLALPLALAMTACTETRVIHDGSVGGQLAQFEKQGWDVSSAHKPASNRPQPQPTAFLPGKEFLGDVHWTTNLPADQVEGNNVTHVSGFPGVGAPGPAAIPGTGAGPAIPGSSAPPLASPPTPGMMGPSGAAPAAGPATPGNPSTVPPVR